MRTIQSVEKEQRAAQIDWNGIRAAAVTIGVREAGRQAASDLPPEEQNRFVKRVLKRSEREGWIRDKKALTLAQPAQAKPLSSNVANGSTTILKHLESAKHRTRSNLAKFTVNASKVAARARNPLEIAGKVKDVAAVYEKTWPEEKSEAGVNLNVLSIGGEMQVSVTKP